MRNGVEGSEKAKHRLRQPEPVAARREARRQGGALRSWLIAAVSLLGLGLGAAGMWLYMRGSAQAPATASVPPASPLTHARPLASDPSTADPPEIEVVLTPGAVAQAGLKMTGVVQRPLVMSIRLPGVVQSNGYREVRVTPLVGGVVTKASAQLGDWVKRGQPLARISSSELAEAQTQLLTMKAELEAEHKKLRRTEELVEIGAASRQELEGVQAAHAVHESHVQAARERLLLLGLDKSQIAALTDASIINSELQVYAPIDGLVLSRAVNQGQVVSPGQELFAVTDLSSVWVIGDLFEKDFAAASVGSKATITSPAYPGRAYHGRLSYVDPRADAQTRTAKVRVELSNPGLALKLGMYVEMTLETPAGAVFPAVPHSAVQSMGTHQVVYLPVDLKEGRFVQRRVKLRAEAGEFYLVVEGLKPGEKVVSEGSFSLRAESLRQHPGQ